MRAGDDGGTLLQQHLCGAVHFFTAFQLVKIPYTLGGFASDLVGVNVGVDVNDLHGNASIYGFSTL